MGPHDCLGAGKPDNGRVQCLLRARARGSAAIPDVHSERGRREEGLFGADAVQGRREGQPHHAPGEGDTCGAQRQARCHRRSRCQALCGLLPLHQERSLGLQRLPQAPPRHLAEQAMKAIDKALVMGASMDGKLLKEAAMAHHNALGSMDGKLVTTAADYEKVNAALGKVIASVPSSRVMDVFNAFSKITGSSVPSNMFSMVSPSEATAAYDAFLKFKDVVKAAQR